jgi:hypothetical protein
MERQSGFHERIKISADGKKMTYVFHDLERNQTGTFHPNKKS